MIDTDLDQFSIIDWSSVTDITVTANISTGGNGGVADQNGDDGGFGGDNDVVDGDLDGGVITVDSKIFLNSIHSIASQLRSLSTASNLRSKQVSYQLIN